MSDLKWVKLTVGMFDNRKIKHIRKLPEGNNIVLIWVMLLTMAGRCNANGFIFLTENIPYTVKMLADELGFEESVVKMALAVFEKLDMARMDGDFISISGWEEHQGINGMEKIREQNRARKQRERERKKALQLEGDASGAAHGAGQAANGKAIGTLHGISAEAMGMACGMPYGVTEKVTGMSRDVTQQNKNKIKINMPISSNENIGIAGGMPAGQPSGPEGAKRGNLQYGRIKDDFNAVCKTLPEIKAMSEARKRGIRALINELENLGMLEGLTPYGKLHQLFLAVQSSDFLSGRDGKWRKCSFDWILKKQNALKILEGNYANKGGRDNGRDSSEPRSPDNGFLGDVTSEALERFRRNGSGSAL